MGQVVLFLDDESEGDLRKLARKNYGKKKGAMARIVKRGISMVKREEQRQEAHARLLEMARNAKPLGIGKFKREELYDRNIG